MNILITGASGFVGKNLVSYLKIDGYEISILNRYDLSTKVEIKSQDVIIHLAGKAHDLKKVVSPDEYYNINTELSKQVFNAFLESDAKKFIMLSSVKAVTDSPAGIVTEISQQDPKTDYGKSKLLAEQYILGKNIPGNKRVYILRPCMIHGPQNKGNFNLLYKMVSKGVFWPLGAYENKRSFCSIENLCFIIAELMKREDIISGLYNVADDEPLSTNELIELIGISQNRKSYIWQVPKFLIGAIARIGDLTHLPLNSERLQKLTESYVVSNQKIKKALKKDLPLSSKEGLLKTLSSFHGHGKV